MKTEQEIRDKVVEIVSTKLGKHKDKITMDSNFVTDLEADSLDLFDLINDIEEEYKQYDLKIPDEDIQKIKTVGDTVNYIYNHIKAKAEQASS